MGDTGRWAVLGCAHRHRKTKRESFRVNDKQLLKMAGIKRASHVRHFGRRGGGPALVELMTTCLGQERVEPEDELAVALEELLDLNDHAGSVDPAHEAHAAAEWSAHISSRQCSRNH